MPKSIVHKSVFTSARWLCTLSLGRAEVRADFFMSKINFEKLHKPRKRAFLVDARKKKGKPHICLGFDCNTQIFSIYRRYCDFCLSKFRLERSFQQG